MVAIFAGVIYNRFKITQQQKGVIENQKLAVEEQKQQIEKSSELVPLDVNTIEQAGGSVRCMLAGIHLSPRPGATFTI